MEPRSDAGQPITIGRGTCRIHSTSCTSFSARTGPTMWGFPRIPRRRLEGHRLGLDPRAYTYRRRPVKLVWAESFQDYEEALAVEREIKGWSHAKKSAFIEGGLDAVHAIVKADRRRREAERKTRAERSRPEPDEGRRSRSASQG